MTRKKWYLIRERLKNKLEKREINTFFSGLWQDWLLNSRECISCEKRIFKEDAIPIEDESSPLKYICIDCDKKEK